jgi:hypothetical protein
MKFNVTIPIEIEDNELLELINDLRDWNDLTKYKTLEEIPEEEILKFLTEDEYLKDEIEYYSDFEEIVVTIVKE